MGGNASKEAPVRSVTFDDLPIPGEDALAKMFYRFLEDMNLPDTELSEVMKLPPEKKWRLIYDKNANQSRFAPSHYVYNLRMHTLYKGKQHKKLPKDVEPSDVMLNHMAISLSTNALSWVKEFCDPPNNGTSVLLEYLAGMEEAQRQQGDADKCIVCLKSLMNNSYGFNSVMLHPDSIKLIALNIKNDSLKTRVLVFELLGAICLVGDGHRQFLDAMDHYKVVYGEKARFADLVQSLQEHASETDQSTTDFQIACMSLINVVVHSCEDMNLRVFLQAEFSHLGILSVLKVLQRNPDPVLHGQLEAYQDNYVDVGVLQRGVSEAKAALKLAAKLEDELQLSKEHAEEDRGNLLQRIAALEKEYAAVSAERDNQSADYAKLKEKVESYERTVELLKKKISVMKLRVGKPTLLMNESASVDAQLKASGLGDVADEFSASNAAASAAAAAVALPPTLELTADEQKQLEAVVDDDSDDDSVPPPPAPPSAVGRRGSLGAIPEPPPPAPPPMMGIPEAPAMGVLGGLMEPKRVIQPSVPLPTLNWQPLRTTKNTVFEKINDENVLETVDFSSFEDQFKTNARSHEIETRLNRRFSAHLGEVKKKIHVLDSNRSRNVVLAIRKIGKPAEAIASAITDCDLSRLTAEHVDLLLKVIPTAEERLLLSEKVSEDQQLAEGDRFLYDMSRVDRYEQKLKTMSYMGTIDQELQIIMPQIDAIIVASNALRQSERLIKILEVVLAFGNYLNSSKRGGAYGFKVTSFDRLSDTRSADKKTTLLQYIARTVKDRYPDAVQFYKELRFVDKAALVSLPILEQSVNELKNGLGLVAKEKELQPNNAKIKRFYEENLQKVLDLQADYQQMRDMYNRVVRHFGDDPDKMDANEFFSCFTRFVENWEKAMVENAKVDKALAKAQALQALQELQKGKKENHYAAVTPRKSEPGVKTIDPEDEDDQDVSEPVVGKRISQIYDGALDDLIRKNKFVSPIYKENKPRM